MNTSYKTHMQAMNAARKEFGKDWKLGAKVEKNAIGEWEVNIIPTAELEPLHSAVAPLSASSPIPAPIPAPAGRESVETSTEDQQSPAAQALINDAAKAIEEVGEDELERFAEAQRQADAQANAAVVADRNEEAVAKGQWVHKSSVEKPTKKVWHIADAMVKAAKDAGLPPPTRSQVQEECVRQGIASGTARTQYQHWFKACKDSAAAPIATINADGTISMPKK